MDRLLINVYVIVPVKSASKFSIYNYIKYSKKIIIYNNFICLVSNIVSHKIYLQSLKKSLTFINNLKLKSYKI